MRESWVKRPRLATRADRLLSEMGERKSISLPIKALPSGIKRYGYEIKSEKSLRGKRSLDGLFSATENGTIERVPSSCLEIEGEA